MFFVNMIGAVCSFAFSKVQHGASYESVASFRSDLLFGVLLLCNPNQ